MYVSKYHQGTKVFDHWSHRNKCRQLPPRCCIQSSGDQVSQPAKRSAGHKNTRGVLTIGVSWPRKKPGLWKPPKLDFYQTKTSLRIMGLTWVKWMFNCLRLLCAKPKSKCGYKNGLKHQAVVNWSFGGQAMTTRIQNQKNPAIQTSTCLFVDFLEPYRDFWKRPVGHLMTLLTIEFWFSGWASDLLI